MCSEEYNNIYCVRHGSPLLIAVNDEYAMVVSEHRGFSPEVTNYITLTDSNLAILSINKNKVSLYYKNQTNVHTRKIEHTNLTPAPYQHWMLKEIYDQPESCRRTLGLGARLLSNDSVKLGGLSDHTNDLLNIKHLILLGCGTSHHASLMAVSYFKDLCDFETTQAIDGSEFESQDVPRNNTGLILISQSGETRDLQKCIDIGRQHNLILIGVVNVVDSLIARSVDCGCYLNAGHENAVASTKSFTCQVVMLAMIAVWFAQNKNINHTKRIKYITSLRRISNDLEHIITECETQIPKYIKDLNYPSLFIIGKGQGEAVAREGALKIKEVSYIHAEGYSSSSLKHGPLALLEPHFPVIILATHPKVINAFEEIKSREAHVLLLTNREIEHEVKIPIMTNEVFSDLLCIVPLQFIAYHLAIVRSINPDFPRNLAKVVTVE